MAAPDARALQEMRGNARGDKLGEHVVVAEPRGRCVFSILPLSSFIEATSYACDCN